jgi:hypothetical protein
LVVGVLIVAVLAILAGGSFVVLHRDGGDGKAATGTSATTTVVTASDAPPELKNTGEDWDQIVRSISGYLDWLFTHPHPELLDNIMLNSYKGYNDQKVGLTNLATKGWHYDPHYNPGSTELVRLQDHPRPDLAVVFVRSFDAANRVVDAAGKPVIDTPGAGEASVLWTLQRVPPSDSHWRLANVTPFTDQPPKP